MRRRRIVEVRDAHTTSDLYFAAYLFCRGAKLLKAARQNRRVNFVFESGSMLELMQGWQDGTAQVVGSRYADACKHLKQLALAR